MGVCTNGSNIQTDILSEALYDVTEIHTGFKVRERIMEGKGKEQVPHRFKDDT